MKGQIIINWFYMENGVRNIIQNGEPNNHSVLNMINGVRILFSYKYQEEQYQPHSYIKY